MTTTPAARAVVAYAEMCTYKSTLRTLVAADLGNAHSTWEWREIRTEALRTMALLQRPHQWTVESLTLLASAWGELADLYSHDEAAFASRFAALLSSWAVRCGDIGTDEEEWEMVPFEEPVTTPVEVPAPAEPIPA